MLGERHIQEAAEPLLAMLHQEGAEVGPGVIVALGHLRDKRAVEDLVFILFQGKDWRKERARWMDGPGRVIKALLQIGTEEALEAVLETGALDFSEDTIRALSRFKNEKVTAALAEVALRAGDDEYGWEKVVAAVESLSEVGGELAISTLRKKLDSSRKQIVLAASRSLDKIGYSPADEAERVKLILAGDKWEELADMRDSAVPLLIGLLISSPSREMQHSAAVGLQRLSWSPTDQRQKARYFLVLGDFDQLVALGDVAIEEMLAAISDREYGERAKVPRALARMQLGPELKIKVLNALVSSLQGDLEVVVGAMDALVDMKCPEAAALFIDKLAQDAGDEYLSKIRLKKEYYTNEEMGCAFCKALGRLGDARAAEVLRACAANTQGWKSVQLEAQAALDKIHSCSQM